MPTFTYNGPDERVYPTLGLTVRPGDTADLDDAPDGLWSSAGASAEQPPTEQAPTEPVPTEQA